MGKITNTLSEQLMYGITIRLQYLQHFRMEVKYTSQQQQRIAKQSDKRNQIRVPLMDRCTSFDCQLAHLKCRTLPGCFFSYNLILMVSSIYTSIQLVLFPTGSMIRQTQDTFQKMSSEKKKKVQYIQKYFLSSKEWTYYLLWMINNTSDFLRVTFQYRYNLFGIFVEYSCVAVISTSENFTCISSMYIQ